MKTTVELREVLEARLGRVLAAERAVPEPFRLKRCTFKGKGLARAGGWANLRARIYEGRGA